MKISISGKGIHRREIPGIEKLRSLPADWYAFTNLELVSAGAMPKEIDVVVVLDDRVLIVDLKDWHGKITGDGDRWFLNDRAVDTSPVKKILSNARIMKGLLDGFLKKAALSRGQKFNFREIPLIEGCVVLTGRCDIRGLPEMEKSRVFQIDDFCRFIQDPRDRVARLATPPWIDKVSPYTAPQSKWRSDLARFFGASEGYFRPLDKRYGDYKVISDYTYRHPNFIFSEYDVEETSLSHGLGLLRLWDFSQADPRYASEEARTEIAGREQNVISYLIDRQPDLESVLIRPKIADPDKGIHYWEVFERRRQLRRLSEFLASHSDELTTSIRVDLGRTLLSHVAAMHRVGAAHLDLGEHSVWMELPSSIRVSHLVASSYQQLASLGARRFEFLAGGTVLPETIIEQEVDHFRKDVFLLAVVTHSILFGKPPVSSGPGEPPTWSPQADPTDGLSHLHGWFERSLDVSSADRFANAQEMLDSFNRIIQDNDKAPNALERLQRFRRWKSVFELYTRYPIERVIKETDRIVVWISKLDGKRFLVKTWRRSCWGDELKESPRLAQFCEMADDLINSRHPGLVQIVDVGYLSDHLVLIQEYVDASDLATTLAANDDSRWLQLLFVANFLKQLTELVIDLHDRGFTHGDLKPANMLVLDDDGAAYPVLIDLLDFGPETEGTIATPAYSPAHHVGSRERDRFAVLQIATELLGHTEADASSRELVEAASNLCRNTEPQLATLSPLLEALEQITHPVEVEPIPKLRLSFPGLRSGKLQSDEGLYYVWLQSPSQFTVTGCTEELICLLSPSVKRKITGITRKTVSQSQVSRAERRCSIRLSAAIEVAPDGSDVTDLDSLIGRLLPGEDSTDSSTKQAVPVGEAQPTGAGLGLDEDVIVEDPYPASASLPLDIPDLWRTLLQVEEEQFTRGVAEIDSSYSRERRRHTVIMQITSGTLDFTREDRVLVELKKADNWSPVGILDVDLSRRNDIAVDASLYKARDGSSLCTAGAELRFRSMMETDSRMRRKTATNRILRRGSVSPHLIDYFSSNPPEPATSGLTIDPVGIGQRYELNDSQVEAFRDIIANRPVGLLQGPPGTGKTKFIAALVHYLLVNGFISNVLLTSQSHEAVNNATEGVLRLFRNGDVEPSLVRVGQEGSISEVLKPYHSAKVEAHYRDNFKAGLKQRFEVIAQQIGLSKAFADDLHLLESTVWPVLKLYQDLCIVEQNADADATNRVASLKQTLVNLHANLKLTGYGEIDWDSPSAYDETVDLLINKHRISSAEQVRKLRGVANLARDWMGSVSTRRRSFEEFLANTRRIVAGTCVGLGRAQLGLASARFDLVIVDEAARCTASELAVPMQAGKWILLVGDHLQLEPFHDPAILRETQRRLRIPMKEIVRSDFERSFESTYGRHVGQKLTTQYRMLPNIGRLVSTVFYENSLKHGRTSPLLPDTHWPASLTNQLSWLSTDRLGSKAHQTVGGGAGRSLSNPAEATAIGDLLRELDEHEPFIEWLMSRGSEEQPAIGIICTYAAQSQLVRQRLRTLGLSQTILNECKIDTVDSYQGKENLLVILSLVRNNEDGDSSGTDKTIAPGFMARSNRMNVALSRAMDKLVIIGAHERWPTDGVMDRVAKEYQVLCEEGVASLSMLASGEPLESSKRVRKKKQPVKGGPRNG